MKNGNIDVKKDNNRTQEVHTFGFIGGLHRSGTSLLARCLADHPEASGFANTGALEDEGQHLQSVYPAAGRYGGPGKFGFAPEIHLTEDSPLVTEANRQRLLAEWGPYWDCERRVLIEKSPPNLLKMRFLQAMFPGARFIVVLRHPAVNAFATQKWSWTGVGRLVEHWLVCNEAMAEDLASLEHVTLIRYEDLIAEGDEELMRLHRFLGVEPMRYGLEPRQGLNDAYLERWRRLGRLARWRALERRLPESRRRSTIERRFEERVNRFGYSLRNPGHMIDRESMFDRLIPCRT